MKYNDEYVTALEDKITVYMDTIRRIRECCDAIDYDINESDKILCHVGRIRFACAVAFPKAMDV